MHVRCTEGGRNVNWPRRHTMYKYVHLLLHLDANKTQNKFFLRYNNCIRVKVIACVKRTRIMDTVFIQVL